MKLKLRKITLSKLEGDKQSVEKSGEETCSCGCGCDKK